ncbi:MAG: DUF2163 domain-containing protein [Hyphomicrobiaceae bacterium]
MKSLPPSLQSHLDTGATTLCWCWRLTRRTDERYGFTDHDRDLTFDGTTFEAATGFTATEIRDSLGLSVDNLDVTGALVSDRLSELALSAGDFDDAAVEIFRVNWQSPSDRVLMRSGSLGEVRRAGSAFTAEVRGLAHYLQQPKGRLFQYGCDADLGDARCGIDLSLAIYRGEGTIADISGARVFTASGLDAFAADWFTRGLLTFTTGDNAGRASEIKRHAVSNSIVSLELWREMGAALAPGDTFIVTAGCDKQFATCKAKFANAASYRGFPHMPGNDFIASYPRSDDANRSG